MALIEEEMIFTLTSKYHNLYVAKKKVFSVLKGAGSSLFTSHSKCKVSKKDKKEKETLRR